MFAAFLVEHRGAAAAQIPPVPSNAAPPPMKSLYTTPRAIPAREQTCQKGRPEMAKVTGMDGKEVEDAGSAGGDSTPFNYDAAEEAAKLVEIEQSKIDEIMDEAKTECAPSRERIANIYKDAAEKGATRKVIKHVVARRTNERRQAEKFAKLSEEHKHQTEQLSLNLEESDAKAA